MFIVRDSRVKQAKSKGLLCVAAATFIYAGELSAAPSVSGSTISVPDDGWYQFQSADDFSTICEGVTSCTVSPGSYTVINHTSGERFENVMVSADTSIPGGTSDNASDTGDVTVDGNLIRWPDNGWYQVQSAVDFATICQGGRSCEVAAGRYIVINHTTGQRFEGIEVSAQTVSGSIAIPGTGNNLSLSGNTLSWTGTDWYQIQSANDFSSVCEGGNSCTVSAGIYNIINHTDGLRIDNFVVEGSGGDFGGGTGEMMTVNPLPPSGGDRPSLPPNARGSVYSSSDLEIFWDASTDNGFVIGYDIYRDGIRIRERLDGRSFFDSSLAPGTNYEYRIVAIDNDGNESEGAVVTLQTQGEASPAPAQNSELIASAQAPVIDANNQVSWPFGPVDSGLRLVVERFITLPLASNGRPARWNDLETFDDRLFVVDEQDGRIFEITNRRVSLWFDVGAAVVAATGRTLDISNVFHGGVRGIAFHPEFASNGKLYVSLLEQRPADPSQHNYLSDAGVITADSVLVEWTADPTSFTVDPLSYREVFRVGIPEFDHPIKQIAFDPTVQQGNPDYGLLYIAHGDGSRESSTAVGGQGNNALGKILRINPLANGSAPYSVPGNNPFVGNASMLDEVYTIGHRNPHHLAFTNDGTLLVGEDGRDNIDEINLITAGADYGWSQREGAYVQLDQGTLSNGIDLLPADDANTGFTYPVAQFGHTGSVGAMFTGQALGGGFVMENGSELDGQYFYIDFPISAEVFHSSFSAFQAANTRGAPDSLTMARTGRASISFDQDNNPATDPIPMSLREIVRSASGYDTESNRVDVRYGQGPRGELYLLNKRNNEVYLVSNSLPPAAAAAAGGNPLEGVGPVQQLGSNFGFLEGPVYNRSDSSLYFSDIDANTIFQLRPDGSIVPGRENQPTNGLAFDLQNRLLVATQSGRNLIRIDQSGSVSVLAERFEGALLNSPNDLALHTNGDIYFTDPPFGIDPAISEVGCAGIYRLQANGSLSRFLCNGIDTRPNGIVLSPSQDRLYANFTFGGQILTWPVAPDGSVGEMTTFAQTAGFPDGMVVDEEGNLFVTSSAGVEVFAPNGTRWGVIEFPEQPANATLGGPDDKTLFVTARTGLYSVQLQ